MAGENISSLTAEAGITDQDHAAENGKMNNAFFMQPILNSTYAHPPCSIASPIASSPIWQQAYAGPAPLVHATLPTLCRKEQGARRFLWRSVGSERTVLTGAAFDEAIPVPRANRRP